MSPLAILEIIATLGIVFIVVREIYKSIEKNKTYPQQPGQQTNQAAGGKPWKMPKLKVPKVKLPNWLKATLTTLVILLGVWYVIKTFKFTITNHYYNPSHTGSQPAQPRNVPDYDEYPYDTTITYGTRYLVAGHQYKYLVHYDHFSHNSINKYCFRKMDGSTPQGETHFLGKQNGNQDEEYWYVELKESAMIEIVNDVCK